MLPTILVAVLDNPVESALSALVTACVTSAAWVYLQSRRQRGVEGQTAVKEWQEYAKRQRLDGIKKDEKIDQLDEKVNKLEKRSKKCEDREERLRSRVRFLEQIQGVEPEPDSGDELPKVGNSDEEGSD